MQTDNQMYQWTLHLCLASYLAKDPQSQIKRMAKRYRKQTANKANARTLKLILTSPQPVELVRLVYAELNS